MNSEYTKEYQEFKKKLIDNKILSNNQKEVFLFSSVDVIKNGKFPIDIQKKDNNWMKSINKSY